MERLVENKSSDCDKSSLRDGVLLLERLLEDPKIPPARQKDVLREITVKTEGQPAGSPLLIASLRGYTKVVELLLAHNVSSIEETGEIFLTPGGIKAEGATALWVGAYVGHFDVIQALLSRGANANHVTKTKSTPLRTACFRGRLGIARCLVEYGADVTAVNDQGNTCLMAASYGGHSEVVTFLIGRGSSVNAKDQNGNTSLHFAAERGRLEVVQLLHEAGAIEALNNDCMTPLSLACNSCQDRVVTWLIGRRDRSRSEVIDALELLGATYANLPSRPDTEKAYRLISAAMQERFLSSGDAIHKALACPPIRAYSYRIECQTPEDLAAIKYSPITIRQEGLIIRERILGAGNRLVPDHVRSLASFLAEERCYLESVELLKHAAKIATTNGAFVLGDLNRIAQLLVLTTQSNTPPAFKEVEQTFRNVLDEVKKLMKKPTGAEGVIDKGVRELCDKSNHATLALIFVTQRLHLSQEEEKTQQDLVHTFLSLTPPTLGGGTLLHLAAVSDNSGIEAQENLTFPSLEITQHLLSSGANVHAQDDKGNTPLHVVAALAPDRNNGTTSSNQIAIIRALLLSGACATAVNKLGQTAVDVTSCPEVRVAFGPE